MSSLFFMVVRVVFPKRLGEEILAFSPVLCPEIKYASSGKEVRTRGKRRQMLERLCSVITSVIIAE